MANVPDRANITGQEEVLAFLADKASHGIVGEVRRIDTHGAIVFLAGANAYKIKRAVRFSFLDFSTLAKRKLACDREMAVNRDNAPAIYLGVVPVTRSGGALHLGGEGEVVEWAVHMRRFDEEATLDRLAMREGLSRKLIGEIAHAVALSHERASASDLDAAAELRRYVADNGQSLAARSDLFPRDRVDALTEASLALLERNVPLLQARRQAGYVRRCHGDLHLRNIALIDGRPVLFDALEFDEAMATGDVLYDLAFLVMDLWERGFAQESNAVLNHYLWEAGDETQLAGLALLPLYLSVRAAIRAKVIALPAAAHANASKKTEAAEEARRYFALAERFLRAAPPILVAIGGLSGTGKTTVAAGLAPHLGRAPGAIHLRSDVERKRLFSVAQAERLPQSGYSIAVTEEVYGLMRRKAGLALAAGFAVVADAVHALPEEREAIERVARELKLPFEGLWLEAPLALRVERVEGRRDDASDADAGYVRKQAGIETGAIGWRRIEASPATDKVIAEALEHDPEKACPRA